VLAHPKDGVQVDVHDLLEESFIHVQKGSARIDSRVVHEYAGLFTI
jgi:hypothetical protein